MSFEDETATGSVSDVLGAIYMMLDLGNDRSGQFFTPAEISKLMARLLVGDGSDVRERGFLRLNEPACGAGGMVIAYADALQSAGLNYQDSMHAICVDVDAKCVYMTFLQLALLHIPAIVVHGNALSMEQWSHWYTPAHVMGGWRGRLARERDQTAPQGAPVETPEDGAAGCVAIRSTS